MPPDRPQRDKASETPAPPEDPARAAATAAMFAMQETFRDVAATLRGEVAQLVADGFTDDQARAIVASQFGWSPGRGGDA